MPAYSYLCECCKYKFEEFQKMSDEPLRKCPECGKLKLKRQIESVTVIFKGTGWTPRGSTKPY